MLQTKVDQFDPSDPTRWTNFPRAMSSVALTGGNAQAVEFARTYFDDFTSLFEITRNGTLRATTERLAAIEAWYNRSNVMISLITAVPTFDIHFATSAPGATTSERADTLNFNKYMMLNIYGVCYVAMVRMATTLGRAVPVQYVARPQIQNPEEEDIFG